MVHYSYEQYIELLLSWKSVVLSEESIENIATSDSNFAPTLINYYPLRNITFSGNGLINNSNDSSLGEVNSYISYTPDQLLRDLDTDFTLKNCLFVSVKLTKNADLGKYKYGSYGIGFDSRSELLFIDGSYGKNVFIFGAGTSSSVHVDSKGKNILILGEGPTQRLDDSTSTSEAYTIMEATVSYLLMLQKYINLRQMIWK